MKNPFKTWFAARTLPRPEGLKLVVTERRREAEDVLSFRLEAPDARLPPFAPGAHIDVHLDNGLVRQYSICSDPADDSHYRIAVLREERGRGGSLHIHATWTPGTTVRTSLPHENFSLADERGRFHLIAGGIGIAPLLPMVLVLCRRGDQFSLHYCASAPERAAFARDLVELVGDAGVAFHYSRTRVPNKLDVVGLLADVPEMDYVYCCGPAQLIDAVQSASRARPADRVRCERFTPPQEVKNGGAEPFEVVLARSGDTFTVPVDKSLLEVLQARGYQIEHSCREGICGTCRVPLIQGNILHRDHVLSDAEKNTTMAACVSRARGYVVLDL